MGRLPDAEVKRKFPPLLLRIRCVGSADVHHAASSGITSETRTPEESLNRISMGRRAPLPASAERLNDSTLERALGEAGVATWIRLWLRKRGSEPCRLAGAHTGARRRNSLQIGLFETVSKAGEVHWPLEGSNPSPSAQPSGSLSGSRVGAGACGLSNRNARSTEVRGGLRKSTGLRGHWRTSGALWRRSSFSRKTTATR
jgi:hypothetical protein